MDCSELFAIFNRIGGEFVCDYKNNKGTMLPQNIKCDHLHHAANELDYFLWQHSYLDLLSHTNLLPTETVSKMHRYQNMSHSELRIKHDVQWIWDNNNRLVLEKK